MHHENYLNYTLWFFNVKRWKLFFKKYFLAILKFVFYGIFSADRLTTHTECDIIENFGGLYLDWAFLGVWSNEDLAF